MTQEEVGPELHMDFAFMGDEESGELLTILVAKERTTAIFADGQDVTPLHGALLAVPLALDKKAQFTKRTLRVRIHCIS